ncbi:unnamed protein product [Chondrus crispus]|uniref:Uncharacterized protein n=1 Tax=Chondrus crispus TaxID=2769 RepID=R7QGV9_CHOCR|nr:unnamed protein product [Chondrus crispus]CDF36655.1 unnamed protein product [Chondrus crispus]|eukprot:XP_005716474.1 unnamed protein product [Chondrus crispus]
MKHRTCPLLIPVTSIPSTNLNLLLQGIFVCDLVLYSQSFSSPRLPLHAAGQTSPKAPEASPGYPIRAHRSPKPGRGSSLVLP